MILEYRLSERKKAILRAIIKDYIRHGEPLGSRTLVKRHGFSLSPATVRNEMAELEDAGLLIQPHTSAGRIPSDQGYRFFVDHLMDTYIPSAEEKQFIRRLAQTSKALDAVLSQAIRILSDASHSVAIAETPRLRRNPLKEMSLTLLNNNAIVLGLHYENGMTRHSVVNVSQGLPEDALSIVSNYLNHQLKQFSLEGLFHRIATSVPDREMKAYTQLLQEMISEIFTQVRREERVYMSGTSHLLREPEFQSMEHAFPILRFLEDEQVVHQLFSSSMNSDGAKAHNVYCLIGYENNYDALHNCSFIATPYFIGNKATGMIGILGPTRMNYSKIIALLQTVTGNVTQTLTQLFN